jgi:hypothetical protein
MDNRYFKNGCPALMQDARFITNYTESRIFEQFIRKTNNIGSAQDYKRFLQDNADTIMQREREYLETNNKCNVDGKCVGISGEKPW